ncbi:MAG TPA: cation:proton antiporter [Euryarchaeota archaeon]|nr:Na(+)/H(+) antiporter subunit C [archaeon BMS3Abin16]HDH27657.1 cation:proton antiporter [Euryarchaeota archaeon]HDH27745.1 cation:proton antiporter [Euryarchaeota archaeon]
MIYQVISQYNYIAAVILFFIGLYTMISRKNLIKKIIGLNIMDTSVFLFFISMGSVEGGKAPIIVLGSENVIYVNPLPQALILTAIVVAVSVTAFALALTVKLYGDYGTLDADKIRELREEPG